MPMKHYGHEEQSEIVDRVHQIGGQFFDEVNNLESQNSDDETNRQPGVGVANPWQTPQPERKTPDKSSG